MATQSNKEVFLGGFKKLFKDQWQTDVVLKAGDSDDESATIYAHKFVLSGRSEVFKKMLESDDVKASAEVETITLSEMKHEEVEALAEFMYSVDGSICSESLKKHVRPLYLAADKYQIPHLRDLCRNELISSLNSDNSLSILELAQIPFDKALNDAAFTTIKTNITVIASSPEFNLFVVNHPNLSVEIMKASLTEMNASLTKTKASLTETNASLTATKASLTAANASLTATKASLTAANASLTAMLNKKSCAFCNRY